METEKNKVCLDDFTLLSVLGKGAYAKVVLVRKKDDNQVYAMKTLKKDYIEKKRQEEHTITERNVLADTDHPFIIKMFYSFQNEKKLFFVLEYCPGGELFSLLVRKQRFNEDVCRFYSSQILLALEYLHSKNVIYRDLKPENVIIDQTGYVRITDFGLSKSNVEKQEAKSICGTPEYFAPEVIQKLGHGKPVDWWCLGNFIYELIVGTPPYTEKTRDELWAKIKQKEPKYYDFMSADLKDLLQQLLQKDPAKRLGFNGAEEIKKHPWFGKVDFNLIQSKQMKPPFVPKLNGKTDLAYFDTEFTEMQIDTQNESLMSVEQKIYGGWSYNQDITKK